MEIFKIIIYLILILFLPFFIFLTQNYNDLMIIFEDNLSTFIFSGFIVGVISMKLFARRIRILLHEGKLSKFLFFFIFFVLAVIFYGIIYFYLQKLYTKPYFAVGIYALTCTSIFLVENFDSFIFLFTNKFNKKK